tara:strand:+ start:354 stop:782 length:429 start_codon:yes stop_codon:yes gene_type:complete
MAKDSTTELQTAYYTLLNNNITLSGTPVKVYDDVPASATYPLIQFGSTTFVDNSTKSTFMDNATFSISIVDRFALDNGSRSRINNICNQIKQIIRVRPVPFILTNFNVITSVVDNDISRKESTSTFTYFIRDIRFRHVIEEK